MAAEAVGVLLARLVAEVKRTLSQLVQWREAGCVVKGVGELSVVIPEDQTEIKFLVSLPPIRKRLQGMRRHPRSGVPEVAEHNHPLNTRPLDNSPQPVERIIGLAQRDRDAASAECGRLPKVKICYQKR